MKDADNRRLERIALTFRLLAKMKGAPTIGDCRVGRFSFGRRDQGAPTLVVVVVDVVVVILDYHAAGKVSSVQNCRSVVEFVVDFTGELPRFERDAILAMGCKKRSRVRCVTTFLR